MGLNDTNASTGDFGGYGETSVASEMAAGLSGMGIGDGTVNAPSFDGGPGQGQGNAERELPPWQRGIDYNGDGEPDSKDELTSAIMAELFGLDPQADPNAFLFGMQNYYTPQSYADYAHGIGALPRDERYGYNPMFNAAAANEFGFDGYFGNTGPGPSFQQHLDATGQREAFDRWKGTVPRYMLSESEGGTGALNRYMRSYQASMGSPYAFTPNVRHPSAQLAYGQYPTIQQEIPEWFRPGGEVPGPYIGPFPEEEVEVEETTMRNGGALKRCYAGGGMVSAGGPQMRPATRGALTLMASQFDGGRNGGSGAIRGPGTGRSDSIDAVMQETGEPIKVANNEHVITADVVAALGDGSSDAGHAILDDMMRNVREQYIARLQSLPDPGVTYG